MKDSPAQLYMFTPTIVLPMGDGSYRVTHGKPQEWLSTAAASRLCGISQATMSRWARDGVVTSRRMGPQRFQIQADSLKKFLEPFNHLK
jgi:hypothetical protein